MKKRNWRSVAQHYLASLGSFLFYVPYGIYKGVKTAYHLRKKEYEKAAYNLSALLTHIFIFPLYSIYRAIEGAYELGRGKSFPWYK